jgi:hypothetical protein
MRACDRCAGGRRGWGQSRLVHGGGRSLDEDPLFCFVCSVSEPTMESDRWPVSWRGEERTDGGGDRVGYGCGA